MNKQILKFSLILSLVVALVTWAFYPTATMPIEELEIGSKAPMTDVQVKDVSGEMLTLQGVAQENGLLVIFSCNTCPWVQQWEDRYNPIANLAKEKNVGMIALNPNTTYRDRGDGFEDMKQRAQEKNYQFPYALDDNAKNAENVDKHYLRNAINELAAGNAISTKATKSLGCTIKRPS